MFSKILVTTDGSDLAEKAVDHAIAFCKKLGASMIAVNVRSPKPMREVVSFSDFASHGAQPLTPELIIERMEGHGRKLVDAVASRARSQGVQCDAVVAVNEQPYRGIIEVAEQQGCSMIFMASHGYGGIDAILLGSVTQKVLAHSKIPVLVFR